MTSLPFFQQSVQEDLDCLATTFVDSANELKNLLLDEFSLKIAQKQLYCQSRDRLNDNVSFKQFLNIQKNKK